ncbi:MAG: acylneuraminate cytidylyltransferase family protein [Bacteroidetes bacterium]|nr:acylneuraminate cytidylyltransferase family protein [Bacteroidota bacterium]
MALDPKRCLILIPARAGSKGVPNKNVKPFNQGMSLTSRAIELAKKISSKDGIVLSTDSQELLDAHQNSGITCLMREEHLASDTSGMLEVMIDAIDKSITKPEFLILLQPTSPFRTLQHIERALSLYEEGDQAVVAVNEPKGHPFYTLFEQKGDFIEKFQKNEVVRRQDISPMYDVNGLLYIFHIASLREKSWVHFDKIRPMVVPFLDGLDIDTEEDWWLAETIAKAKEI